ncbi:PREDICTED: DTW domain-containing protein 2-like [Amphimedon queenslandica]|uniref:tRNA-uridine aminocarboxypropyltransferase n=1 Tax=Amphimedon queenslandica TaxID=400682 RepID=A0A1X7VBY0_AMPQE|nr:PREDICTED: DTW domain-containing protein 2-like [Amphimedon queenslandica]|eukprot:XP_003384861.2 PREDICTED: DTW domain-containing protein 2-like [Amphimedon queenslandica]
MAASCNARAEPLEEEKELREEEDEESLFAFPLQDDLEQELIRGRAVCGRCKRPSTVCICSCFPEKPVSMATRVIILQHCSEESRCLATVPLLQECITRERFHIIKGKRFKVNKFTCLQKAIESKSTVVLYPSKTAIPLQSLPSGASIGKEDDSALIVLDGTWAQTRAMFSQNHFLHSLKQVKLNGEAVSQYVIRTQPSKQSLSTIESVAHAVAWLDGTPEIIDVLLHPLIAMCQYQLEHGATTHFSKDHPRYMPRADFKRKHSTNSSGSS